MKLSLFSNYIFEKNLHQQKYKNEITYKTLLNSKYQQKDFR